MFLSNWPIKTLSLTSEEGFFVDKIKVFLVNICMVALAYVPDISGNV